MKSHIILISIALATALPLGAWQRSGEDMRRIAKERLVMMTPDAGSSIKVNCVLDKEMISVYEAEGKGYVVVSRSTTSSPVLGYSDRPFNADNMPDGLKWWLDQADRALSASEASSPANSPESPVSPMLTTCWAQDRPFNNLCPATGFWGSNAQTGCVATAMAQVLNYFKYPASGTGKGSYSTDGGNSFKTVEMKTIYNWDKMRDVYGFNYSDDEAKAVAELMRDCGYASKMVYYETGSGALLYDGAWGLAHNLQYDSLSMKVMTRMFYRDEEWTETIRKEMTAGRPILYMGVDPNKMGHAFVLDGMDAEGRVHVNWGWSGDANGYFDIAAAKGLAPSYLDPYSGQDIKYCFSDEHMMVIGLNPSSTPAPDAEYESFFAGYTIPELEFINDSLIIETTPVFNFSHLNFKGLLGLVIEGEDGHAVVQPFFYSPWEKGAEIPVIGGLYYPEEYYPQATLCDTDGQTPRPDGKYLLYFVSWSQEEMEAKINPRYIRYPVALAEPGKENYAVWEAKIVNGHWDPASLRLQQSDITGIQQISSEMTEAETPAVAYSLDGRCLGDPQKIGKGMPVVVRKGDKSEKVIIR